MIEFSPPEKTYDGYLFDCDGTLADTMPLYYEAWKEAIGILAPEVDYSPQFFYSMGGLSVADTVHNINRLWGTSVEIAAADELKEAAVARLFTDVQPIKPLVDYAHACLDAGHPVAVVSGSPRSEVEKTLHSIGLLDRIPIRVCQGEVARGKPAPDPFLRGAELLGVEPTKCLVLEDSDLGVQSAIDAGMDWIKIPNTMGI